MKDGYYVIRTYEAGCIGEKTKVFVPCKRPEGPLSRRQKNAIKKQEQNEYSAVKNLARLMNANGKPGDLLMGLDYSDEGLEKALEWGRKNGRKVDSEDEQERLDAIRESAAHMLELTLRRAKNRLAKLGMKLKAIYITSDMDGKTGEIVRVHHHLIVENGTQDAFKDAWEKFGMGTVDYEQLWDKQLDRTPIAEYFIRQVRRIPDAKKFRHTQNLKKPKMKTRIVSTDNELQVPRGGKIIFRRQYDNEQGFRYEYENRRPQYIRYILPAALKQNTAG